MTIRADITPELIRQLIRFDEASGKYFWRPSPSHLFATESSAKRRNARYVGKETMRSPGAYGYFTITISGILFPAHRVIWAYHYGEWPKGQVDHINHDRTDNSLSNLREVTNLENARNKRKATANTSGVTGVSWHSQRKRWRAAIVLNGKHKHLGRFVSIEDAIAARRSAEQQYGFHANHGR